MHHMSSAPIDIEIEVLGTDKTGKRAWRACHYRVDRYGHYWAIVNSDDYQRWPQGWRGMVYA